MPAAQVGEFSKALIRIGASPPLLIDGIAVGEQTGKTNRSRRRAVPRYDKEFGNKVRLRISASTGLPFSVSHEFLLVLHGDAEGIGAADGFEPAAGGEFFD